MLWSSTLPLSFLFCLPLVVPSQLPLSVHSTTLIDALSNDSDYTSLLKLLQLASLIPTINKLNGGTLFAPTNDAIEQSSLWQAALFDSDSHLHDNIHERLRQELFYHLLNYSLPDLPAEQVLQVHKTLHYPRIPLEPPSRQPPPSPPWMPIPGGSLGGEPQRLRLNSAPGEVKVGVDAFGKGGVPMVKGQVNASNGVLVGIGKVLDVPPDLATVISHQQSLSYLNGILKPEVLSMLNSTPELTLFVPVDAAWNMLHPIEKLYLKSEFAADDIIRIINMHAVASQGVHWSDSFEPAVNVTTVYGSTLQIVVSPEETTVSSAKLLEPDIYASNGVLHTVSSLLIPPGALQLTPEKYLLTLNCTSFVSLLHSVDLTPLINSTDTQYTILAPNDDALELYGGGNEGFPEKGSEALKRLLLYHFIPGRWTPQKLKDRMLLETSLEEVGLDGGRQVLDIEVSSEDSKRKKERTIRFGGAGVIAEEIEVNNTIIYLISRPLVLPSDALETALPSLELSSFLAAVFSTSLADYLKKRPRATFLIPENDAFKRLGMLVSGHLLAASSKPDLERVILHHVIDGVEYSESIRNGSQQTFPTLDGSDVHVSRPKNGSVIVKASGGWAGMEGEVTTRNMLTQTGVIHELSDILLPRSVNLTVGKLVKAAKGSTMAALILRAGMDWVLNGTAPPEGSPWAKDEFNGVGWTLLCPTDEAFKGYNLTRLYENAEALRSIVQQHLIPTLQGSADASAGHDALLTNRPLAMDDSPTYTTLQSASSAYGDVVFRVAGPEEVRAGVEYVVGIKNARGTEGRRDWARVLSWGRSTTGGGIGGVIQIDQLLIPYRPPRFIEYGAPIIAGVVGVILIGLFFLGVRAIWRRDTTEATYEPVGGFEDDDSS